MSKRVLFAAPLVLLALLASAQTKPERRSSLPMKPVAAALTPRSAVSAVARLPRMRLSAISRQKKSSKFSKAEAQSCLR